MEANPKFYLNRNYQISMSGSLMVMMIAAPIVPAFPKIISAFGIGEQSVGLLLTAFTFPNFLCGPLGGRFHAPPLTIGIFIAIVGVMTAIASLIAGGKLIKRFSAVSLVAGAFVIYAFSMIIIPFMPDLWFCLVPIVIYGFAHGLNLPSLNFIGSRVTPLEHRAGFMALQEAMITLGMTISPLIMGLFYSLTNLDLTFILTGLIALIVPALAAVLGKERLTG